MSTGYFAVLNDDSSSEDDGEKNNSFSTPQHTHQTRKRSESLSLREEASEAGQKRITVPSYEDLSTRRTDEVTVLEAVYGPDFSQQNECKFLVHVRPPDVETERIGSHLTLCVELTKKYPYVIPALELQDVQGLSNLEMQELMEHLKERARSMSQKGEVMMMDLVQVVEDFLCQHNRDPTMSGWEQMKAREAAELEKERQQEQDLARLMNNSSKDVSLTKRSSVEFEDSTTTQELMHCENNTLSVPAFEKELLRQQEALEAARLRRTQRDGLELRRRESSATQQDDGYNDSLSSDDDDEDGGIDLNLEDNHNHPFAAASNISRYTSDFIELGILGRGGGGEVVKVRNRLDRRIYAVKKIILESEQGRNAQYGAEQNRKLRREVTTISRMTHKNVVRYYQAWVEYQNTLPQEEATASSSKTKSSSTDHETSQPPKIKGNISNDNSFLSSSQSSESSSSSGGGGFWKSPSRKKREQSERSYGFDDDTSSAVDKSARSSSLVNILELENGPGFGENPLFNGLGGGLVFQNQIYDNLFGDQKQLNRNAQGKASKSETSSLLEDSSVKVGTGQGKNILYIQMEYCSTTLRKLIDDGRFLKMEENKTWRLITQILEALVYIHNQKIIHRDLKPGNVFIDREGNVRLGDFGLATTHEVNMAKDEADEADPGDEIAEAEKIHDAIENISGLLGGALFPGSSTPMQSSTGCFEGESMTCGVGTTYYRAPEQESFKSTYTWTSDMFSFGIILFEIFHAPFRTGMERADILLTVRGERAQSEAGKDLQLDFQAKAKARFPAFSLTNAPENAQRIILWCLERNPTKRPSAEELLSSELLPRKIELEQKYLQEALEILTSSQSESYLQILEALFSRPNPDVLDLTFDTDIAAKAQLMFNKDDGKGPPEELLRTITKIRAGAIDVASIRLAMSAPSIVAATSALKRAKMAGSLGKGIMKRSAQRMAGILAMRSAAAAAVTGSCDVVYGADPVVVEAICDNLKAIFQNHGAVHLRSPLLRPSMSSTAGNTFGGPAQLLNERGSLLVLPEDLTGPFARSIARGGSATSNLKRYEIGKVYHKSMIGGHPRETVEASFDVIQEAATKSHVAEAETVCVACQVMTVLPSQPSNTFCFETSTPLWYIRLNHTRLADAILDLCTVPAKDSPRRAALMILTRYTAPSPHMLKSFMKPKGKVSSGRFPVDASDQTKKLDILFSEAVSFSEMPQSAADRLKAFVKCCLPLPVDVNASIECLKKAIIKIRGIGGDNVEQRRVRRFEEALKSLGSIKDLYAMIQNLGLDPLTSQPQVRKGQFCRPLYISVDLGLRQHRKHYHGGILFQCIVLPDDFFLGNLNPDDTNDTLTSPSGRGTKVAEGGNFSELVRRHRPPGNFATSILNQYTAAPIPSCAGIRFSIGSLCALVYLDAAIVSENVLSSDDWDVQKHISEKQGLEIIRQSLGHPFQYSISVSCIVASPNGMDTASTRERFLVASRLWGEGISAEYYPQSGMMLGLLRRLRDDSVDDESDWTLSELLGMCSILNVSFVVIVQPHLLESKGSIRLRRYPYETSTEIVVSLNNLASTIAGAGLFNENGDDQVESTKKPDPIRVDPRGRPSNECVFVEHDQYFSSDREVSKSEHPDWKKYLKTMKSISVAAESYLSTFQDDSEMTIFAAADLSFFILRDFGTALMRAFHNGKPDPAARAASEISDRNPKQRRTLKTFGSAVDSYLRRNDSNGQYGGGGPSTASSRAGKQYGLLTFLLYSKPDDRFDMVTLESNQTGGRRNNSPKRKNQNRS